MEFPVDSYDLKARYAPGLLLALPVLITMWTCFNKEIKEISTFVGVLLSAVVTYGLSVVVRAMGKRLEPKLKEKWGGFPSTLIVTRGDATIGWLGGVRPKQQFELMGESYKYRYHKRG